MDAVYLITLLMCIEQIKCGQQFNPQRAFRPVLGLVNQTYLHSRVDVQPRIRTRYCSFKHQRVIHLATEAGQSPICTTRKPTKTDKLQSKHYQQKNLRLQFNGICYKNQWARITVEHFFSFLKSNQIRVKVIEARQLQGANISPICKITCWKESKDTRVRNSTNSPFWDQTFFFNFFDSAAEMLDQQLVFTVYDSRRLRRDSMIGSFKFDLSIVYECDRHAMLNKWLLLCNPEDPMSGAKGYLKISVVILGPGDEAPVSVVPWFLQYGFFKV